MKEPVEKLETRVRRRLPALWHFIVRRFKHGERYGLDFTIAFIAIVAAMWGFVSMIEATVTESELFELDLRIQSVMSAVLTPQVTEYVVFITNIGGTRGTAIGVILVGLPLLFTRRWWSAFGLVFAAAGGGIIIFGLKLFFHRARPVETVIDAGGFAFPSGHAFAAMVFFGYLIHLSFRHFRLAAVQIFITLVGTAMIFLVGSSRVYLNVHWLTDVVGGWLAGFAWLLISILIVRHIEWPRRGRVTPAAEPTQSTPPAAAIESAESKAPAPANASAESTEPAESTESTQPSKTDESN